MTRLLDKHPSYTYGELTLAFAQLLEDRVQRGIVSDFDVLEDVLTRSMFSTGTTRRLSLLLRSDITVEIASHVEFTADDDYAMYYTPVTIKAGSYLMTIQASGDLTEATVDVVEVD